jgi:hypothetical protein
MHSTVYEKGAICPSCGTELGAATHASLEDRGVSPKPGDFSICWTCGALNRFTEGLQLKECDLDKLSDTEAPPEQKKELRRLQAMVRQHTRVN